MSQKIRYGLISCLILPLILVLGCSTPVQAATKQTDYEKLVMAKIESGYLNVRKKPSTEAGIVGRMEKGYIGEILKKSGDWTKIKSGKVTGYVRNDYIVTGNAIQKYAEQNCSKKAKVKATNLNLRKKPNMEAEVITQLKQGKTFAVLKDGEEWVKLKVKKQNGYVSREFVTIFYQYQYALTTEEANRQDESSKDTNKDTEKDTNKDTSKDTEKDTNKDTNKDANKDTNKDTSKDTNKDTEKDTNKDTSKDTNKDTNKDTDKNTPNSDTTKPDPDADSSKDPQTPDSDTTGEPDESYPIIYDGTGADVVDFAEQFIGNSYVYGGTSLTTGADCSGFVLSVYRHFNVTLPRTSSEQSKVGTDVTMDEIREGDLIFYANNGSVYHVAIYAGDNTMVHAVGTTQGIKRTPVYSKTPYCIKRVIG